MVVCVGYAHWPKEIAVDAVMKLELVVVTVDGVVLLDVKRRPSHAVCRPWVERMVGHPESHCEAVDVVTHVVERDVVHCCWYCCCYIGLERGSLMDVVVLHCDCSSQTGCSRGKGGRKLDHVRGDLRWANKKKGCSKDGGTKQGMKKKVRSVVALLFVLRSTKNAIVT